MNWHIISADVGTSIISLSPKTELNQFPKQFTEKKTSKWHLKNREKRASKRAKPLAHNSIKLKINTAQKNEIFH